jgi:flagellar protein FliS
MPMDEVRARYLRDRVLTATPAQRVVMLYDRLGLDLTLAESAEDEFTTGSHLGHAMAVVIELQGSLDVSAGGPAQNLGGIYAHLLTELVAARGGDRQRIAGVQEIVGTLRDAWAQAADIVAGSAAQSAHSAPASAGAWVS